MSRFSQSSQRSMRNSHTSSQCHGRLRFLWIYVFILGLSCLLETALVRAAFTCPTTNCTCTVFKDAANDKLQNISCVSLGLTEVPSDRKEGSDVHALNLSTNAITELTASSLVYFTNLIELDLSYNSITSVDSNTFTSLTNLQYLRLEGNDLTIISSALFELENLVYLNLARNPNITFPNDASPFKSFIRLDISHSTITDIPTSLLSNLEDLIELDLSHNSIMTLPKDVFKHNKKLEIINLEGNSLTVAERWFMGKAAGSLQQLDVSHNAISSVSNDFIKDASSLVRLDLSHNDLSELRHNVFKRLRYLEVFDLSGNVLTTIDKKLFDDCENLKKLDLSDNRIESLDSDTFDDLPNLVHLDLSHNKIYSIFSRLFSSISGLTYLDLSYNSLTSLPINIFDVFTAELTLNLTNNPFTCDCAVRNYLYTLVDDASVLLFDVNSIKCTESSQKTIFLDWFSDSCSGNLGTKNCTANADCKARDSECNSSKCCTCKKNYYDNNGDDVYGGVCKTMVELGFPCELTAACQVNNSECISKVCKCKSRFYDTNKDSSLYGSCEPKVDLGEPCAWKAMCAQNHSECNMVDGVCDCVSTHYNSHAVNPTCLEKLALNKTCIATYQCAPDNSECKDSKCTCSDGFHDMDGTGNCLDASSFYSCYLDDTDGANKPVEFTDLKQLTSSTDCQEYCFSQQRWHTTLKNNKYCLCGSTDGSTLSGCCPYSSTATSCSTSKHYIPKDDIVHVTSGMKLKSVPQLTSGIAYQFEVNTTLSIINQIKWNFGDSDAVKAVDGASSRYYHTYTHSGKFTLSVSACVKSAAVCETVEIPVIVQVPAVNLTMWITGYEKADVSSSLTDITATFEQGYDFRYTWKRTDSYGTVIKTKGCEKDWVAHRQICLKLQTATGKFGTAELRCSSVSSSVLELHFMQEVAEIITLLSIGTSDKLYINAKRVGGAWQWKSDGSKTIFSDDDLDDSTIGDYVVIDGSTGRLTSSDNSDHKTICMKDPVDCPYGGSLHSDGECYVLSSAAASWESAKADCISNYKGRLANLKDKNTHTFASTVKGSVSETWFGLSDRQFEGYYLWSDDTSFDDSAPPYMPTIISEDHDCFVLVDDQTWTTDDCHSTRQYLCQYPVQNERLTVPSYIAGSPDIKISGNNNLEQIVQMTTFTSTGKKELIIFPGMWFTRRGHIRSWVIHSIDVPSGESYKLALLVFRPECTDTLIQPGCGGSMFATCSSSSHTCDPTDTCSDTESFCYLTNQCKTVSESCTCISESSSAKAATACNSYFSGSGHPDYRLVGQTFVTVDQSGEHYYTIPADSISVKEHDVIGIQVETGKNVIKCENIPSSELQQTSYTAFHSSWLVKGDNYPFDTASVSNQSCYFQAVYTQDIAQNLTQYLGYFGSTGSYSLSVSVPYSGVSKTLSINLEESVADIKWVYPVISELPVLPASNFLGTVYLEYGVSYDFTLSVGSGTNIQSTWSFNNSIPVYFQSTCPASVLTEVSKACNTASIWSASPFAFFTHAENSLGTEELTIIVNNSISSAAKKLILKTEKRISSVVITYDASANNILAVNEDANFSTAVTDGTGLSYSYTVDGSLVTGSDAHLTYAFATAGNFSVGVTVSNILGSSQASLSVTAVIAANFQNCQFVSTPYIAAVGVDFTMNLTCEVTKDAVVSASWYLNDRPTLPPLSSTETAFSTFVSWTQSVQFSSANSSIQVNVTYTDLLKTGSSSTSVTVYNAVLSVTLTASATKILIGTNVTFTAAVPLSPGNYGPLTFSFEFDDGATDSNPTGIVTHSYITPNTYSVKVIASNGPSKAEKTISFMVVETISGLTVTYDGPTKLGDPTVFTAQATNGTGIEYNFKSTEFDRTVSVNTFSFNFTSEGNYTVSVKATNGLTEETSTVLAYIMDESRIYVYDLTMVGGSFSDCIESTMEQEFTVSAIHYNKPGLEYEWSFGDGTTLTGSTSEKHTYTTGNDYTLKVTVRYPTYSAQNVLSKTVCVQDRINNPLIIIDKKIGLPMTGTVMKSASVNLSSGTSPVYAWSSNASFTGSPFSSTFSLNFSNVGFYFISVNVSNAINFLSAPTIFVEVIHTISNLTINCTSCIDKAGDKYVEMNQDFTLSASIIRGDSVTYSWTFGDGSSGSTGMTVIKSFSAIGVYNISVAATNDVGMETEYITVHVEEQLTKVTLSQYGTHWIKKEAEKNVLTQFKATALPSGMELEYIWVFESGLSPYSSSENISGYNYTNAGQIVCKVTVRNSLNSVNDTLDFFVIEEVTSVDLEINGTTVIGTDTAYAVLNRLYELKISGNTDVQVSYTIRMKKGTVLVGSNSTKTLLYTFKSEDRYSLIATITNNLGKKEQTYTIFVIQTITDPKITLATGSTSISLGSSITLSGSASGTSPEFSWSYTQAPVNETFPSSNTGQTITLTPGKVGVYVVQLSVTNAVTTSMTTNYTFEVMEAVGGVAIQSPLTQSDAVKNGTTVTFTATVTAGSDLSYKWQIGSVTGTQQTFNFEFTTQMIYNIFLNVSNLASSGTTSVQIYSLYEVPSFSVNVSGASFESTINSNVAKTGDTLNFTCSLSDFTFLTLDWLINSVSSDSAQVFAYAFTSAGSYLVMLNASNKISSSNNQIPVLIQDAIKGFVVSNCRGTFAVNMNVSLTATYSEGSGVEVIWEKQNLASSTGDTAIVNYGLPGTYIVNATASNYVDMQFSSCQLTVQGLIDNLVLKRTQYQFSGYPLTFSVSGDNLESATFEWKVSGTVSTTSVPTWDYTFPAEGNYTLTVTIFNDVSRKNVSMTIEIFALKCREPVLKVVGSTTRTALRARAIGLDVAVANGGCTAYTSINRWTLYEATSCSPGALAKEYILANSTATNTPTLLVPGATLLYGSYCAVFENSYENTPVKKTGKISLTVMDSPLQALLVGGDEMVIVEGSYLILDATGSSDPDKTPGTMLTYAWTCTVINGKQSVCDDVNNVTSPYANFTSLTLTSGDQYTITVIVSAINRVSGQASQQLTIKDSGTPKVTVICISCIANGNYKVCGSKSVAIQGTCSSNCDDTTKYAWFVTTATGAIVSIDSTQTSTGMNKPNLVLKAGALSDGVDYIFKLEATNAGKVGFSSISLLASSVPSGGSCKLSPTTIIPLIQQLLVNCTGYTDTDLMSGLYYKIVVVNSVSSSDEYILYYGTNAVNKFYLSPWSEGKPVDLKVYVMNDYGSAKHALTGTVHFSSPSLGTNQSMVDFLVDHINNNMLSVAQKNNPMLLIEYLISILNLLNEESRTATDTSELAKRIAVRDLVTKFLKGLPMTTPYDIQQTASAFQYLTKFPEEIRTVATQDVIGDSIKSLTNELSAQAHQGQDQTVIKPNSLLKATKNMHESYQLDSAEVTPVVDTLFGDLYNYQLGISISTSITDSFESAEQRIQKKVEEMLEYSTKAITILLSVKLADEEEAEVSVNDARIIAQRVTVKNIRTNYYHQGAYLKIPKDVFTHAHYNKEEVFQIVNIAPSNPLQFSYLQDYPINTIVASAVFLETNGKEIPVVGLPDGSKVQMYMFLSNSAFYQVDDPLTQSPGYDPLQGMTYQTIPVDMDRTYELTNFRKTTTAGASLHFQLRTSFFGTGGQLEAVLFRDAVKLSTKIITLDMMAYGHDHRDYTFYVPPGDSAPESAYKIQIKSNMRANISLGFYRSVCQYYEYQSSSWSYSGCVAKDESYPLVIACECNHMTSYGGSVLLSPDQIDFTDLTRLDIPSNPVAIITCSVILGLYIIVAIVCVKLDIMDVRRISTIPLCGKDGSFKYEVTTVTGRQVGAGTTANVGCRIIGEYGKSASQHLNKRGAFQRNCSDSFIMAYDVNLGELKKVLIWHDNRGTSPSWYLDHVIIKDLQTDKKYYFFSKSWLTLEQEKGAIQKELRAASSSEMMKFSHRLKTATYNSLADKHLWFSILNRPAQSRFTRVQRATCCVTLLYTFIAVNAMWYGLLKKNNASFIVGDFGWEEVILGLVSNIMVFPINIGIVYLFKKSRSKANVFEHGRKPQTAETIEIENLCDNSQGGSFQSYGGVPSDLERESTLDSLPRIPATGLHRSRPVKSQRDSDDPLIKTSVISATAASAKGPMWNQDSIMKWPEKMPYSEDAESRPSTSSTTMTNIRQAPGKAGGATRKASVPGTAESEELLEYLDKMETDLKDAEERSVKNSGTRKLSTSTRKQSMQSSRWGSLEDILNSDDESTITDSSKKKLKKKNSTASQISQDRKFNPREEPRINGNGRWLKSRESNSSTTGSMIGGEHFYYNQGHVSSEAGITAGLRPGYHSEMTMESREIPIIPSHTEKCTLPSWCIYIAYVLCFLLCTFSIIIVILYCFKFGYEESLEWVVAFIFSLFQSILLVEPVKAVCIAVYIALVLKKVEQDEDEDCIDIEPTFDSSSEMIKDVKFKPMSGFALMQAKEEGHKMHRMKVMLRQFVAYIFYLWLLMVIVYVNFQYSTYLLTKHLENNFIHTDSTSSVSFNNISSIEDFWDWTENTFADAVHLQESQTDEEHGFLLGVARMRLIRSTTVTCEATDSAANLGASSLTERTCYGSDTYEEDTASYGEGWNDSSYNFSWRHSWGKELGGGHKVGHVGTYDGGGYVHNLGNTLAQTQTIIHDLKSKSWVDLQTRAVVLEFAIYSPGTDVTALSAMLVEFPLTGGVITSYEIQSQKLLWFQENRVDPLMICEAILLLVTIYTLIHIVISIRDMGRQFFKEFWNWYEMLTTLMTVVAIGMYVGCVVEATNTFNHLLDDQTGFTNFERVMYVHVGMRYLHAWLLFLLMYKVVKQLRFIKFMHIYEKTMSQSVGQLLAVGLIFIILLLVYAQVGYLMYGHVSGFESVGHAIVTLIVMIRGTFDFWPMLDYQPVFSHFYVYSYYAFTYGLTIALVIAVLNNMYKTYRSQMFFKATLDMQDYEMIEFLMKRFKLWAGIQKEKPAFRRVKFQGLPSISSRSSSSYSHQTSTSSSHQSSSLTGQDYSRAQLDNMISRLNPTWLAVVKRFERLQDLDKDEDTLVKKAESEVKELNFRIHVNGLEKERRELLNWSTADKPPIDQKQRQSILTKNTSKDTKTDKKPPSSVTGASRTTTTPPSKPESSQTKGKRPLSDQGARSDLPPKGKSSASEPRSLQKFFKQFKPSKPAWNK